jgi:hypothetical protein
MPSTSVKQARFMSAAAHNPSFAKKAGIPVKVAVEFHDADAGHKYGHGMDKKAKALRATKHYRKKARGGSVEGDGKDDTSYGGTLPRSLQPMTTQVPESWTRPPVNPAPKYADGGDTSSALDWGGVGEAMPENIGRNKIMDPVANAAIGSATMYPRYIKSMVDAGNQAPGSEEAHQAYGDVGASTGEVGMSLLGSRGGVRPGTIGAGGLSPWVQEFIDKNPHLLQHTTDNAVAPSAAAVAKARPDYLDFEQMGNGKYEVFDPASGKTKHIVDTEAEAKNLTNPKPMSSEDFRSYAQQKAEEFRKSNNYRDLLDPREAARRAGGYETPAYRGFYIYKGDVGPVHRFEGGDRLYSTANPDLADMYASYLDKHPGREVPEGAFGQGATVAPLYINTKDYHYYDAGGGHWQVHNNRAIKEAHAQGKPGVIVDNVWDEPNSTKNLPTPNKIFITFPSGASTVKSKFAAKFDKSSPNMLHSVTGMGGPATGYVSKAAPDSREEKMASGGKIDNFNPERGAALGLARQGMIQSSVPGRTDKLNMNVPSGSYIIPADIPGAIGQGNSVAGGGILDKMFKGGPYGMSLSKSRGSSVRHPSMSPLHFGRNHFAKGGEVGKVTPIVAAGGEYVVHPGTVAAMGHGDIELGHKILDAFVKHVRAKHITTLKGLKPPKGSK